MNKNNVMVRVSDTVFATVIASGSTIARMTLSGCASMAELIRSVCGRLSGMAGLVTVELRNSTMGWIERRSLRLVAARRQAPVQLTLF